MNPVLLKDCPFCDPSSGVHAHLLEERKYFRILCERHPLTPGHILVVSKSHFSCIGEYPAPVFNEFQRIFSQLTAFLNREYGAVCVFERGRIQRAIFHSHVHFLPFQGRPDQIVTEGWKHVAPLHSLEQLRYAFEEDNGYLFFALKDKLWLADPNIGAPRFFRERIARALGTPEKGNWKGMAKDENLMTEAAADIRKLAETYRPAFVQ